VSCKRLARLIPLGRYLDIGVSVRLDGRPLGARAGFLWYWVGFSLLFLMTSCCCINGRLRFEHTLRKDMYI